MRLVGADLTYQYALYASSPGDADGDGVDDLLVSARGHLWLYGGLDR